MQQSESANNDSNRLDTLAQKAIQRLTILLGYGYADWVAMTLRPDAAIEPMVVFVLAPVRNGRISATFVVEPLTGTRYTLYSSF